MITKQHLKIFLSFLSLTALILVSCSAEDKLGSETQSPQVSGGSKGIRTNIPIWPISEISKDGLLPPIWWGRYTLFGNPDAEVDSNSVTWQDKWILVDYLGNNKWYLDNEFDGYVQFTRDEYGRRSLILDEREGEGRTISVYVHSKDR